MELTLENLNFSYKQKPVLKNISFSTVSGNLLAILGPNGSGKSTLLKCINRLLFPDSGRVLFDGEPVSDFNQKQLAARIGYVPQKESHSFPVSVFDVVLMGRKPYVSWRPSVKDKEKVTEIVDLLNLEDIVFKEFNQLSGGQQQKVLMARALAQEPELLVLDEPTSSLDLRHQLEVLEVIAEQVKNNITALVAMHDLSLAGRYCNQFVVLNKGEIYNSGGKEVINSRTIEEVYGVEARVDLEQGSPVVKPISPTSGYC